MNDVSAATAVSSSATAAPPATPQADEENELSFGDLFRQAMENGDADSPWANRDETNLFRVTIRRQETVQTGTLTFWRPDASGNDPAPVDEEGTDTDTEADAVDSTGDVLDQTSAAQGEWLRILDRLDKQRRMLDLLGSQDKQAHPRVFPWLRTGKAMNSFDNLLGFMGGGAGGTGALAGLDQLLGLAGSGSLFGEDSELAGITNLETEFSPIRQFTQVRVNIAVERTQISVNSDGEETVQVLMENESLSIEAMIQLFDPLVLDLGGDGIDLRGALTDAGFDLFGTGERVSSGFIHGNDALLYLDENSNGLCDTGQEMFGDQHGHADGFAELAHYDENGDGWIDENDAIYDDLRLFVDKNGDGENQEDESLTLAEAGVEAIHLNAREVGEWDEHGNRIRMAGMFRRHSGALGGIVDADFRIRT